MANGTTVRFASNADVQKYLTRSAAPLVPAATVSAAFQSVMGRPPSADDVSHAEAAFNAGTSLADYRASLVASPETRDTLRGISLQVLGRDAIPAELDAYKAQLRAGQSIAGLRSDLAHVDEATNDVKNLLQSTLGRPASAADVATIEVRLANGGSLNDVHQDLAVSQEATLAALDLFAGIVAAHAAALGRLGALAVDDGCRRADLALEALAFTRDQVVIGRFPSAVIAQLGEPAIHNPLGREAVRHHPLCDADTQHAGDDRCRRRRPSGTRRPLSACAGEHQRHCHGLHARTPMGSSLQVMASL